MAPALPGFHALSEGVITGRVSGKGKIACWKVLQELHTGDDIVQAFSQLGIWQKNIRSLNCLSRSICLQVVFASNVADVRWWLFKKGKLNLKVYLQLGLH